MYTDIYIYSENVYAYRNLYVYIFIFLFFVTGLTIVHPRRLVSSVQEIVLRTII